MDVLVEMLLQLKELRSILILENKFTDAGLPKLKPLKAHKALKEIDIRFTEATAAGVAALQKELPNCKVIR